MEMENMTNDDEIKAKLAVLDEIKELLDNRLVDKMKPKAVEVSKVEVEPHEEMNGEESDDDKEELKKIYSKLLG